MSLWRDREFLKVWTGSTISALGSRVSDLAIPLTAVLVLGAGAAEMGLLRAAENAPFIVLGLLAGVIVDRFRRRPILIASDLGAALLLVSIPAAAVLGVLRIEQLYVVGFLVGGLGVVAAVADQSLLPTLVGRARLVEGNAKFRMSGSVTDVVGPSLGGFLVQLFTAPVAIVVDAVSFLVSATFLGLARVGEAAPRPREQRAGIVREVGEGLGLVMGDRVIRTIMLTGATHNLFSNGMLVALYVLYATRELGLSPAALGIVFAAGGPGAILGSVLAGRAARAFGMGATLGLMQLLTGMARLMVPLAAGVFAIPVLMLGEFILGFARAVFNVNQLSLRQAATPDHLQGRMNASIRFLMWWITPIGALVGGVLGEAIGLWPTLLIAALGTVLASLWLLPSWLRTVREEPARAGTL